MIEKISCKLQYFLPHHPLSRLVANFAESKIPLIKNNLINLFIKTYDIDLTDAESSNLDDYACFNDFFTRALKKGARPIADDSKAIVSPADGFVIQSGNIVEGKLLQAKSTEFRLADLLGNDSSIADFTHGTFLTVYLSPRDYHRVHMPIAGTLIKTIYIPGKLFSVNYQSVNEVANLFCRNERLICLFATSIGTVAVILIGAMLVAGIETVWGDRETPCSDKILTVKNYEDQNITLQKGEELGRFRFGSTAMVLFPQGKVELNVFNEKQAIRMGEQVAVIKRAEDDGSI